MPWRERHSVPCGIGRGRRQPLSSPSLLAQGSAGRCCWGGHFGAAPTRLLASQRRALAAQGWDPLITTAAQQALQMCSGQMEVLCRQVQHRLCDVDASSAASTPRSASPLLDDAAPTSTAGSSNGEGCSSPDQTRASGALFDLASPQASSAERHSSGECLADLLEDTVRIAASAAALVERCCDAAARQHDSGGTGACAGSGLHFVAGLV